MSKEVTVNMRDPDDPRGILIETKASANSRPKKHKHKPGKTRRTTVAERRNQPGGQPKDHDTDGVWKRTKKAGQARGKNK